jgi:AcrR family transcriptional regulator
MPRKKRDTAAILEVEPREYKRLAGRPRDSELDDRIIDAALSVLLEHGFHGMSFEKVSKRSRISKPTIYRRYRSKNQLAVTALPYLVAGVERHRSGDTRADLAAEIGDARKLLDKIGSAALLGTLLSEERRHPELLAVYREQAIKPRWNKLHTILEIAQDRGEIGKDADLSIAVHLLMALLIGSDILGRVVDRPCISSAVAVVLAGVSRTSDARSHGSRNEKARKPR